MKEGVRESFAESLKTWSTITLRDALCYLINVQMGTEKDSKNILSVSGLSTQERAKAYAQELERRASVLPEVTRREAANEESK